MLYTTLASLTPEKQRLNVDIVKTVSNLCVYNWESIDGDHCSNV